MALPYQDPFTGTGPTTLSTYNAGWVAAGFNTDTLEIASNQLRGVSNSGDCVYYWSTDIPGNDQYVQIVISAAGVGSFSHVGVGARFNTSTGAHYAFRCRSDGGGRALGYHDGSSNNAFTAFTGCSDANSVSANDVLRIECNGTTIRALINGTQVFTYTDSTLASGNGAVHYRNGSSSVVSDSFEVGNLSTGVTVNPAAATLAFTGATPTVTVSGNVTVAPAAAALAFSGATPTVTAQNYTWYALPAPGSYDSNSILAGQTYPTGSWLRVVTDFAHITYDYAAAEAAGELDNDINDHGTAETGYTGSDSATYEIKTPAGATSQYTVSVTIQSSGITAGPSAATLTMTGATPTVTTGGNQTLSPVAAAMTMTGATPTITGTTKTLSPAAASMVMTGETPVVTNGAPVGAGLPFSRPLSRGLARRIHRSLNG